MAIPSPPPITGRDLIRKPSLLLVLFAAMFPGMDASGFTPFFSFSPGTSALIAAIGGAIGGAIATDERIKGAITGMTISAGFTLGMIAYVFVRMELFDSNTFLQIEVVIGALIGAIPGMLLYRIWFKEKVEAWKRAQLEAEASGARG